jgi:hypothetical protein
MTTSSTTIKIRAADFIRKDNAALVKLLRIIRKAGKDGIATRRLCQVAFNSRAYGMKVINRAEEEGYIKRIGKGKRGYVKVNYLTKKGKQLLSRLEAVV